jgi:hypothetical protein
MKRQIFLATLAASLVAAGCLLALPARASATALTGTSHQF